MKQYLPGLAIAAVVVVGGCLSPTDSGPISIKKKPKKVVAPEEAAPTAAAWTPPATQIPKDYVDSVRFLLAHGMADPRNGTFSRVYLPVRDRNGTMLYYGWVFPQPDGRFRVVGMDGVSRVAAVAGTPAKLDSVLADPSLTTCPQDMPNYWGQSSLAPAMFLVEGRADVASKLMQQAGYQPSPAFVSLAGAFLRAKWTHALAAFSRADDPSALNLVQELASLRPAYEKEAQRVLAAPMVQQPAVSTPAFGQPGGRYQNFVVVNRSGSRHVLHSGPPFMYQIQVPRFIPAGSQPGKVFGFLDQAPGLVADIQRRLAEPPDEQQKKLRGAEEVPTAIESLEDCFGQNGYQNGQSATLGLVPLSNLENALGRSEDLAIPALIDCVEKDKRFSRELAQDGQNVSVAPVRDVAVQVFCDITHAPMLQGDDAATLAGMKTWWVQNKGVSKPEREYRVLADDHATPEAWVQAAQLMTTTYSAWTPGTASKTEYDNLRNHAEPTVSQLMAKRIVGIIKAAEGDSARRAGSSRFVRAAPNVETAKQLCESLWNWDKDASLPAIKATSDFAYAQWKQAWQEQRGQGFDPQVAMLFEHRVELNDPGAIGPYTTLLCRQGESGYVNDEIFRYYYAHRDEPRFHGFAKAVFLDPVIHPVKPEESSRFFNGDDTVAMRMADSPLLSIPEERQAVLHLLQDKTVIGTITNDGKNIWIKSLDGHARMGSGGDVRDELAPRPGQSLPFRVCDKSMQGLNALKGKPDFKPYWPLDVRDENIGKAIALIKAHQSDEMALLSWPNNWQPAPGASVASKGGGFGVPGGGSIALGGQAARTVAVHG